MATSKTSLVHAASKLIYILLGIPAMTPSFMGLPKRKRALREVKRHEQNQPP